MLYDITRWEIYPEEFYTPDMGREAYYAALALSYNMHIYGSMMSRILTVSMIDGWQRI